MARARPIPGLSADEPFALAAARVVAVRAAELEQHSRGVLDLTDIERVHDMRVATRRLRAALEVFAACFPRKRLRAALREVKALADALGERRDRDVMIAALERVRDGLSPADRPGVESLIAALRDEQLRANEALAPAIAADRLAKLRERLADLVREAVRTAAPVASAGAVAEVEALAAAAKGEAVADEAEPKAPATEAEPKAPADEAEPKAIATEAEPKAPAAGVEGATRAAAAEPEAADGAAQAAQRSQPSESRR